MAVKEKEKGFLQKIMPSEDDPSSGFLETGTEAIAKFTDIFENASKEIFDNIGLGSISDMMDEIQAEYQASDHICDTVGGKSAEIPLPLLPNPEICYSPKQVGWAINMKNVKPAVKAGLSCALEENVTEPADFWLSGLKALREGEYDKIPGYMVGALSGEGLPEIVNPIRFFMAPFSYTTCWQAKVAHEMGDLTEKDLTKLNSDIRSFTERDTGIVQKLFDKMDL